MQKMVQNARLQMMAPKPQPQTSKTTISLWFFSTFTCSQTTSQPGEWWVAAGRGAKYPINPARTPTTHHISYNYPHLASQFIIIIVSSFVIFISTRSQVILPVQVALKRDS